MKKNVKWTFQIDDSVNDVGYVNALRLACARNTS